MMDDNAEIRADLKLPEGELGDNIKKLFESGEDCVLTV